MFDDYFLAGEKKCKLKHVQNSLQSFVDHHNKELEILSKQSQRYFTLYLSKR